MERGAKKNNNHMRLQRTERFHELLLRNDRCSGQDCNAFILRERFQGGREIMRMGFLEEHQCFVCRRRTCERCTDHFKGGRTLCRRCHAGMLGAVPSFGADDVSRTADEGTANAPLPE